jgi:PAS domain S-box-containing protein/diguanylate cyclase (GGDEF)-like protein
MCDADIYGALSDYLAEAVYVVDRDLRIVHWNRAAERMTGYLRQELCGRRCQDDLLMHCTPDGEVLCENSCPLRQAMVQGVPRRETLYFRHKNGYRIAASTQSVAVRDPRGTVVGAAAIFELVHSAGSGAEEPDAYLDPDTQLQQRTYAEFRLSQRLARLERFGVPLGWLRIDLEEAGDLERRFGRPAVEAAAALVARTLVNCASDIDFLARWGPTSFRAALGNRSPEHLLSAARRLAAALNASELEWWGDPVRLTVSVGGACAHHGDTVASLEERAAAALESSRRLRQAITTS